MSSEADIANSALLDMGQPAITSLDQNTGSARAMKAAFESVRDYVLGLHPWNFAKERVALAQKSDAPLYKFSHAFAMPNDFLVLLETFPKMREYRVEGDALLCNVSAVSITYTRRVTSVKSMPPFFRETFSAYLGAKTAKLITGSDEARKLLEALAADRLNAARHANALSSGAEEPSRPDLFIRARSI
jgi:hypothetical protein